MSYFTTQIESLSSNWKYGKPPEPKRITSTGRCPVISPIKQIRQYKLQLEMFLREGLVRSQDGFDNKERSRDMNVNEVVAIQNELSRCDNTLRILDPNRIPKP